MTFKQAYALSVVIHGYAAALLCAALLFKGVAPWVSYALILVAGAGSIQTWILACRKYGQDPQLALNFACLSGIAATITGPLLLIGWQPGTPVVMAAGLEINTRVISAIAAVLISAVPALYAVMIPKPIRVLDSEEL